MMGPNGCVTSLVQDIRRGDERRYLIMTSNSSYFLTDVDDPWLQELKTLPALARSYWPADDHTIAARRSELYG